MNEILKETRKQSYKNSNLKTKTKLVFEELGNEELTARELAIKMYKKRFVKNCWKTRNSTKAIRISKIRLCRSSR